MQKSIRSGAGSLGAPSAHEFQVKERGRAPAIPVLGADLERIAGPLQAFDFIAGTKSRAPGWMQRHGLEWVHRLGSEPGRLWKRYLVGNARFVAGVVSDRARRRR